MPTDFINGLRLPIIVLGYDPQRLFSVSDSSDNVFIPVFSSAEYARNYQEYFQNKKNSDIITFILNDYDRAISLFEAVSIANPGKTYIGVDPMPPTIANAAEKILCFELQEYVQKLRNCQSQKKPRRSNRRRKQ